MQQGLLWTVSEGMTRVCVCGVYGETIDWSLFAHGLATFCVFLFSNHKSKHRIIG